METRSKTACSFYNSNSFLMEVFKTLKKKLPRYQLSGIVSAALLVLRLDMVHRLVIYSPLCCFGGVDAFSGEFS